MLLDTMIAGNTLATWAIACGIAAGTALAFVLLRRLAVARVSSFAKRTRTRVDDLIAEVLSRTRAWFIIVAAAVFGSGWLELATRWSDRISAVLVIAFFIQVGLWGSAAARFLLEQYRSDKMETDPGVATTVGALQFVALLVVWAVVLLLALDNLGVNVTALVAGLGVGGIAVALAVQNILGDLFASLAIILDRPFVVGDFIMVDDKVGSVEHIGLKTTRVRSISGEQLVFSNADLLSARVRNFGRMYERRIVFTLGVTYQTARASLKAIPGLIRAAIDATENVRFDRSHFSAFGAFSIDFESVYYVTTPDYNDYMDAQQRIYLAIHEAFEAEEIEFAYPTQTLFVEGSGSLPKQQARAQPEQQDGRRRERERAEQGARQTA
jgi:small-conductance mechanosensitive channel